MELKSLFVLIDYCKRKSLQKRIQSPVQDIISFIQGIGSCIGYRSSVAKMYQKLDESSHEFVTQIMKNLDPVGVDTRRGKSIETLLILW